jgi:hypothetical protein
MISGLQWTLKTVAAAAEAELNDDSALRERLLEAEMQREMGEISDDEFALIERDLLQAIREIKARREGGSGAIAFSAGQPIEAGDGSLFQVDAEVTGDFYEEPDRSASEPTAGAPSQQTTPSRAAEGPAETIGTTRKVRTRRTTRTTRTK